MMDSDGPIESVPAAPLEDRTYNFLVNHTNRVLFREGVSFTRYQFSRMFLFERAPELFP